MNPINSTSAGELIAAQLSQAAYTPLATYQAEKGNVAGHPNWASDSSLPAGWYVDTNYSNATPDNQFIAFVNPTEQQMVITFKGT